MEEDKVTLYDAIWEQVSRYDEEYAEEIGINKLDDEDIYNIMFYFLDREDIQSAIKEEIEEYVSTKK